ncbi:MAG: hypothetical protein ABIJ61_11070 [bacterium]
MRKLVTLLLGGAMLLSIIIAGCGLQSGLTEVADKFFQAVAANDYEAAYALVSSGFRRSATVEKMRDFLESRGLDEYASANWSSWEITTEQGTLEGTITTTDGSSIPVTVILVKSGEDWRIHYIDAGAAGVSDEESAEITMPEDDALKVLATESVLELAAAINAKDFTDFYNYTAELWQAQSEPQELQGYFQEFVDEGIDMTYIKDMEPVFSEPPAIDEDDVLHLKGYFTSQPSMTYFELDYLYEHPSWRLIGINVEVK